MAMYNAQCQNQTPSEDTTKQSKLKPTLHNRQAAGRSLLFWMRGRPYSHNLALTGHLPTGPSSQAPSLLSCNRTPSLLLPASSEEKDHPKTLMSISCESVSSAGP